LISPPDNRDQFIDALRAWTDAFMSTAMAGIFQYAKEQGVSMPQIGAMFRIRRRGSCGVSEVGLDLGVTNPAASQMLERLVLAGLVERREDPDDRRARQIVLTERGHQVLRGAMEARTRSFGALADRLSPRERGRAAASLRTLAAHAGDPGDKLFRPAREAKEHSST
jgi:DNA-binding MarR family transcriptional regulator